MLTVQVYVHFMKYLICASHGLVPRETQKSALSQNQGKRAPVRVLGFGLENELLTFLKSEKLSCTRI